MRGKLKRECAANKQNVNGEADESDNIVASDFQLFFIFLKCRIWQATCARSPFSTFLPPLSAPLLLAVVRWF